MMVLSKLPEGRKPLPDAWFKERAQMQYRIKELEAKLAIYEATLKHVAQHETPDTIWVDFNEEGAVVAGGAGPARYAGEHTYVKARGGHDE